MRLLVVEDDPNIVEALTVGLSGILSAEELTVCRSRDSAVDTIGRNAFDYAILDLKLPTMDEKLDSETSHGETVFSQLRAASPGTPICFLTGYATEDFIMGLFRQAEKNDVWGSGTMTPMVEVIPKKRLDNVVHLIINIKQQIEATDEIELVAAPLPPFAECRTLRIYGRRHGAAIIRIEKLTGGLSGIPVRRVSVHDKQGTLRLTAAARIGGQTEIRNEIVNYYHDVVRLPNGRYSAYVGEVFSGAGPLAGVFYRLIEDFESLSTVVQREPERAARVVQQLEHTFEVWTKGMPLTQLTVREIRESIVSHEKMARMIGLLAGVEWEAFEQRRILARICAQHRDLHCENVLVHGDDSPIIIDFANVGNAPASFDPIALELSLIFHPGCQAPGGAWPTLFQAERWHDIDAFATNCPAEAFVRAARQWAHKSASGNREIYATAYTFCLRQLTYLDTDKNLALAILRSVITAARLI